MGGCALLYLGGEIVDTDTVANIYIYMYIIEAAVHEDYLLYLGLL